MKYTFIFFSSVIAITFAFQPPLVDNVGVTAPFQGKFDPLGFSDNVDSREFARLREAELKHARWGMISATSIPLLEIHSHQPAIHAYDRLPGDDQLAIAALILAGEFTTMILGYENPFTDGSPAAFKIRKDYQPGDLGFNLVNSWSDEEFMEFSNKELNNGRLAMIAALGMIVQELVTDAPLF